MANYKKILENTTANDIDLTYVGITIEANSTYELERVDWIPMAREEAIAEIDPYLLSGDILVYDGVSTTPLSYVEAKKWLEPNMGGLSNRIAVSESSILSRLIPNIITTTLREVLEKLLRKGDHHSGWWHIKQNESVFIDSEKQMTNYGILQVDGHLIIDGTLILED